jgi:hypothetical protein
LFLLSSTRTFPLEGKDGLALWGQTDAEKCMCKVQAGKEFASAGIRSQSMYGFGTTGCRVTVAELTACR